MAAAARRDRTAQEVRKKSNALLDRIKAATREFATDVLPKRQKGQKACQISLPRGECSGFFVRQVPGKSAALTKVNT